MKVVLYTCACGNAITLNSLMAFHEAQLPGRVELKFTKVVCSALAHAEAKPEMTRVEVDV